MTTFENMSSTDWSSLSEQRLKQEPEWFEKLIDSAVLESTNTTTGNSPLEFSSLFDLQEADDASVFTSNTTSLDNTPLIKAEDAALSMVPQLCLLEEAGEEEEQQQQQRLTRNSSMTSMDSIESQQSSSEEREKKPKKKRAPRKRLTAHQKQAHNKIEKRYRININAKIAGLQQIIPWLSAEKTAFETGDGAKLEDGADFPRLNKSMILEKATGYILHLQEKEKTMEMELQKLKADIDRLGGSL